MNNKNKVLAILAVSGFIVLATDFILAMAALHFAPELTLTFIASTEPTEYLAFLIFPVSVWVLSKILPTRPIHWPSWIAAGLVPLVVIAVIASFVDEGADIGLASVSALALFDFLPVMAGWTALIWMLMRSGEL
jgi:hypothetical protein